MNKHYVIRLTSEEREQQHEMVAKGKTAAQGIRPAHILPPGSAARSAGLYARRKKSALSRTRQIGTGFRAASSYDARLSRRRAGNRRAGPPRPATRPFCYISWGAGTRTFRAPLPRAAPDAKPLLPRPDVV